MKKFCAIFLTALLLLTTACGYTQDDLEEARQAGYDDGYEAAELEFYDSRYSNGYDAGYSAGYETGLADGAQTEITYWVESWREDPDIMDSAADELHYFANEYAHRYSGWCPEDAVDCIREFQDEDWPSDCPFEYPDFVDSIESLILFFEYFYYGFY